MDQALTRAATAAGVARRLVRRTAAVGAVAAVVLAVAALLAWTPTGGALVAWLVVAILALVPAVILWTFQGSLAAVQGLPQRLAGTRRQVVDTAGRVAEAGTAVTRRRGLFATLSAVWSAGRAARDLAGEVEFAPLARLAVPGYLGLAALAVVGVGVVVGLTLVVLVAAAL